ncbi:SCO6745 family protein, partial [Streptomyces massasporeus]
MWHLLEPLHALLYYAPEAFDEAAALGYDTSERWPSYFAWRAAPLGPVGADRVADTFYSFSPAMIARYVPAAWETAAPADVLAARLRAVDRTYRAVLGEELLASPGLAEAAALARTAADGATAASGAEVSRPLAVANAALPRPEAPHVVLWQSATNLREHRGDGHLEALVDAGLDPVESLVSFAAIGAAPEPVFESRGWSGGEWAAARTRLVDRGLLTADGAATEAGRALRAEVERRTDELAVAPWAALGPDGTARLAELLGGPWLAAIGSGL